MKIIQPDKKNIKLLIMDNEPDDDPDFSEK